MEAAVLRYRALAYITGVLLVVLVFVGMPLKYLLDQPMVSSVVGITHGMLCFPLYLLATFDLWRRARWPVGKVALVVFGGVIPFLTFWVERKITDELRATA